MRRVLDLIVVSRRRARNEELAVFGIADGPLVVVARIAADGFLRFPERDEQEFGRLPKRASRHEGTEIAGGAAILLEPRRL